MKKNDMALARKLKAAVEKYGGVPTKGTLRDYMTVYADHKRGDGNYAQSKNTALYQKYSVEYCILLEVISRNKEKML